MQLVPLRIDWLKHSFFYIRVCANPRHYGVVGFRV
jgi:hypothetical protein